jgi:hypothetical protein
LTLFGFIHSVAPNGDIYIPWMLDDPTPVYRLALAYVILGGTVLVLALVTGIGRAGDVDES